MPEVRKRLSGKKAEVVVAKARTDLQQTLRPLKTSAGLDKLLTHLKHSGAKSGKTDSHDYELSNLKKRNG